MRPWTLFDISRIWNRFIPVFIFTYHVFAYHLSFDLSLCYYKTGSFVQNIRYPRETSATKHNLFGHQNKKRNKVKQWQNKSHMIHNVGKGPLHQMWTAKLQISTSIHAVWSEHSLFVNIYYSVHWFFNRTTEAKISLCECAGWSWPVLSVKCIRALFVRWHHTWNHQHTNIEGLQ